MGTSHVIFLENIEWFDSTGKEMVHRIPEEGSGEIKFGAQLTVRENQVGVFFYQGKAVEAFGPGRHTLKTANIPILTKVASIPWALSSPLRAEVYMVNMKTFTDLKWGTRDPVAFKDSELGLIRLRAFGVFNLQIVQPVLFINRFVGTQGIVTTEAVEEYLNRVIVSRFNEYMGETIDSIFNLPAKYEDMSSALSEKLTQDFSRFGLCLEKLYVISVTPPPEVQQAIDDRSRMAAVKDLDKLMQMKAAMAMEKAAEANGTAASGMGMGLGLLMPAMFAQYFANARQKPATGETPSCPECGQPVPVSAKFCPHCGHQILIFQKCAACGKNLAPGAKFCSRCGKPTDLKPAPRVCSKCGAENMSEATYCDRCGEKL